MYDVKPVTTPHQTACGPAALKMLLGWYGINVPLDTLTEESHVSVDGCTARDLKRVGNAHGLDIRYFRMDAETIMKQDRPAILWWRRTHFIVFCGLNDAGEPVICNPSSGRYPISRDTFETAFSGIALFNGTPDDAPPDDFFGENEETSDIFDE